MDYVEGYAQWLETDKRASANTVSSYLRDVRCFSEWLTDNGLALPQVSTPDVKRYAKHLERGGKSDATVVRSIASLKSFYNYMVASNNVGTNPAKGYMPVKAERKLPQILTSKEVDLFLEQPDCSEDKGVRDKAMLELLYATGIRVSELIALDLQDLSLSAGFIRCETHGKERMVPLYPTAVKA